MAKKVAWGIDVGDSAVKVVKLSSTDGRVVLEDYDQEDCGLSPEKEDEIERNERVRTALRLLRERNDFKKATIVVSMPAKGSFLRHFPLPPIERKRLPEIVKNEARQLIPFPIEEVVWDYHIMGEPLPGEEFDINLFAMKVVPVRMLLANLDAAKITADAIQISNVALYNLLYYDRDPSTGTVLVDIGSGNTDLLIFEKEKFWARHLPISGNDLTKTLQAKFKMSFEEAEDLKRKAQESSQGNKIFEIMRGRLEELTGEIHRSIGYYKSQVKGADIKDLILMGNSFKFTALVRYFEDVLEYSVSCFDHLEKIETGPGIDPKALSKDLLGYGPALGCAIQGLGLGKCSINLLPADVIFDREMARKRVYAVAAGVALAAWFGYGYSISGSAGKEIEEVQERARSVLDGIQKDEQILTNSKNWGDVEGRINDLALLTERRDTWVRLINGLNMAFKAMPKNRVWIDEIKAAVGGSRELLLPVGGLENLPSSGGGVLPPGAMPAPGGGGPGGPGAAPAPGGGPGGPGAAPAPGGGGPGGPGAAPAPGGGGPGGPGAAPAPGGGPAGGAGPAPAARTETKQRVGTIEVTLKGWTREPLEFILIEVQKPLEKIPYFKFDPGALPVVETKERVEGSVTEQIRIFTIKWVMPVIGALESEK